MPIANPIAPAAPPVVVVPVAPPQPRDFLISHPGDCSLTITATSADEAVAAYWKAIGRLSGSPSNCTVH